MKIINNLIYKLYFLIFLLNLQGNFIYIYEISEFFNFFILNSINFFLILVKLQMSLISSKNLCHESKSFLTSPKSIYTNLEVVLEQF